MTKRNIPEPDWKQQLYAYGFTDEDIDAINVIPQHRFFIQMNELSNKAMMADIKSILAENSIKINKDIAEIIITQNERWGTVITGIMTSIDKLSYSVSEMKKDNDLVHEELKDTLKRLMWRNNYWMIVLRLAATATITYFIVRYAHDHWWSGRKFLSLFGL